MLTCKNSQNKQNFPYKFLFFKFSARWIDFIDKRQIQVRRSFEFNFSVSHSHTIFRFSLNLSYCLENDLYYIMARFWLSIPVAIISFQNLSMIKRIVQYFAETVNRYISQRNRNKHQTCLKWKATISEETYSEQQQLSVMILRSLFFRLL